MPMYTVCIARFNGSSTINVYSATLDRAVTFSVDNIVKSESKDEYWSNFVRGAIKVYREKSGRSLAGFDVFIDTQVPLGGGLSSSASLAVAVITVCEALTGRRIHLQTAHVASWTSGSRPMAKLVGQCCSIAAIEPIASFPCTMTSWCLW